MAVSKDLLDILVCPLCKAPVHLVHYETGLKCEQCKRVYPIRDDIPVMLIDEATTVDSAEGARLHSKAAAGGAVTTSAASGA